MKSLFVVISLVVTCTAYPQGMAPRSDFSLAKYIVQEASRQALNTDPATSSKCFALHLPLLEKIANQWSTDHNRCVSTANGQADDVVAAMKDHHDAMSLAASDICQYISTCQGIEKALDFFNCFSKLGKNSMSVIYTISNNASDDATNLLQQLELVDAEMYKCTNISERTYIKDSADVYDALNKCLQNGQPDDTDTTTTANTTHVTEEESTVEPTTTTEIKTTGPPDIITNPATEFSTFSTNMDSQPMPEEDLR